MMEQHIRADRLEAAWRGDLPDRYGALAWYALIRATARTRTPAGSGPSAPGLGRADGVQVAA